MSMRRVIGIVVVVIALLLAWSYASTGEVNAPTARGEARVENVSALRDTAVADETSAPAPSSRAEATSPELGAKSPTSPMPALEDAALARDAQVPSSASAEGLAETHAERDRHQAWVKSEVQPLAVQRTEVTAGALKECLAAGACRAEDLGDGERCNVGKVGRDDHPANCVTLAGARSFCAWQRGRLPSLTEWRAEATDGGQQPFPWGRAPPTCERALILEKCGFDGSPVCSRPLGDSRSGLCDLAGGVDEWTEPNRKGEARVMGDLFSLMMGTPLPTAVGDKRPEIGFRCVRDEPGP